MYIRNNQSEISVSIPVYNGVKIIEKCIDKISAYLILRSLDKWTVKGLLF